MNPATLATPERATASVASVARLLSRAGLVEAFGHVSCRLDDGYAITSIRVPLGAVTADEVLRDPCGEGVPLEAPLHAAIYSARADVAAICRTHSPAVVAAGASGAEPPAAHGLAVLSGTVALFDDPQLVTEGNRAARAAAALGDRDCLIMRGNGALATAPSPERAAVRAWFLEERARVWLQSGRSGALSDAELAERSEHWRAESERAWRWLQWRFGDEEEGDR